MYRRVGGAQRREQLDHPLDLAPAAEMNDVAEIPAAVGPRRGFAGGVNAEAGDELGRVGRGRRVGEIDLVQRFPRAFLLPRHNSPPLLSKGPTAMLNGA